MLLLLTRSLHLLRLRLAFGLRLTLLILRLALLVLLLALVVLALAILARTLVGLVAILLLTRLAAAFFLRRRHCRNGSCGEQ